LVRVVASVPNASSIFARSWCTDRPVVSKTRSASERSLDSKERSAAMPSASRPSPCSGWPRRTCSKRRISTSSVASRKSTFGLYPRASRSLMTAPRSSVKARLRTSITTATRVTAPLERAPRSTIVAINSGGRLSTTNQPRSSRHLAAVLRPAPERPLTTATSIPACSSLTALPFSDIDTGTFPVLLRAPSGSPFCRQRRVHGLGQPAPEARDFSYFLHTRLAQLPHRSEVLEQRFPPSLPQPRNGIQCGALHALGALGPVVGDGEAVRLVADPLQQVERFARARQDHRVRIGGQPDLFQALGQCGHRDIGDAELGERVRGRVGLRRTAVDEQQVGRVRELLGPPGLRIDQRRPRGGLLLPRSGLRRRTPRGLAGFGEVAVEPAADHFRDRADIAAFGPVPDGEPPVLLLARNTVLEHHQRSHHVTALDVADVHAFDPQRRAVQ